MHEEMVCSRNKFNNFFSKSKNLQNKNPKKGEKIKNKRLIKSKVLNGKVKKL